MKFLSLGYFSSILLLFSILGCSKTSYWSAAHEYPLNRNNPCEIKITDSTYTICSYNRYANRGEIEVFESEFKGDTLLVYDCEPANNSLKNETFHTNRVIVAAFLRKGNKMFPLYWDYPPIYELKVRDPFGAQIEKSRMDRSGVACFPVNWIGSQRDSIYININGHYQTKGKYKVLRNMILQNNNGTDSTLWEFKEPCKIIGDSIHNSSSWTILYGTLTSRKNEFIDLR